MNTVSHKTTLRNLFGDNRAEWPPSKFRELFVEPTYFSKLESLRPSLLVGGRGTGKTTALRSLCYDATLERLEAEGLNFGDQQHLGILVRVNKNHVHAFQGGNRDEEYWGKAVAHYFNIQVCIELTKLASWLEQRVDGTFSKESVQDICVDFNLERVESLPELERGLRRSLSKLQIHVNNIGAHQGGDAPILSIAEAPLRTFAEALERDKLTEGRTIFCCVDEYENFLTHHQSVINTYIKHAEPPLSYKVGVRGGNGIRTRQTIDGRDLLSVPDDYEQIEIVREGFEYFARAVAEKRLARAADRGVPVPTKLENFLEDLTLAEEAMKLGASRIADEVRQVVGKTEESDLITFIERKPDDQVYFVKYWSESGKGGVLELSRDWYHTEQRGSRTWADRINNYRYSSLFWISKGRKGARFRKYYCGKRVITTLAGGNIRYFLELIDMAISEELGAMEPGDKWPEELRLQAKSQTQAATDIGPRRLRQIEGLAEHGIQLKRLALAIGKVFFELARNPLGSTPEVTQFVLGGARESVEEVDALLKEGVEHLCFVAHTRTKATSNTELKDDEYRLHPIYCAFFEISHRRKRRLTFDAETLKEAMSRPSRGIAALLGEQEQTPEEELPDQLAFFSSFYQGR